MDDYPLAERPRDDCACVPPEHASSYEWPGHGADSPQSDYPGPHVFTNPVVVEWSEDQPKVLSYRALGQALAQVGDVYRDPTYGSGLLLASPHADIAVKSVKKGADLAPIIADRLIVVVRKDGNIKGSKIPNEELTTALASEAFLGQFKPLDRRVAQPLYLPLFELCKPGYNDHGRGNRILYVGAKPTIGETTQHIDKFLDVMDFDSNADRTNAVAAALTVMLRNHWPGGKPLIAVTATKSHAGKDTILDFARGCTPRLSITYQSNWAVEKNLAAIAAANPDAGMFVLENARLDGAQSIQNAFVERLLTDPKPILFTTGTGSPRPRDNDFVLGLSSNFGKISEDLMNRALPIHLAPRGNVQDRKPDIGNPRTRYLPRHREEMAAELRGMIAKWKDAGSPLARDVLHPFTDCAQTVGGILKVNGFTDFLANYAKRKTCDDELRCALAQLGAVQPDAWLRPAEWAALAKQWGFQKKIIPPGDRENDRGCERGIGVVFTAHEQETFVVESDSEQLTLRLESCRRRFTPGGEPETRYRFAVVEQEAEEDPTL